MKRKRKFVSKEQSKKLIEEMNISQPQIEPGKTRFELIVDVSILEDIKNENKEESHKKASSRIH